MICAGGRHWCASERSARNEFGVTEMEIAAKGLNPADFDGPRGVGIGSEDERLIKPDLHFL